MMRRLLATLTVTSVASAIAVQAPAVAAEEPVIGSITVRPGGPVVRATGSVRLLVDVVTSGADRAGGVSVSVEPGPPSARTTAAGAQVNAGDAGGAGWETWRFQPGVALSRWYPSGQWTVTAVAKNAAGVTTTGYTSFYLKRATELEGVVVKRAAKGAEVTGTLLRVDPRGRVPYRPFAGQRVAIQVRPKGTETWRTLATAVTGEDGWFAKHIAGKSDRTWRVEYAGTNHYAPNTSQEKHISR